MNKCVILLSTCLIFIGCNKIQLTSKKASLSEICAEEAIIDQTIKSLSNETLENKYKAVLIYRIQMRRVMDSHCKLKQGEPKFQNK